MRKQIICLALASMLSPAAFAAEFYFNDLSDDEELDESWRVSAEVGLLLRTGNTESQSWTGKIDAERDSQRWRHRAVADYYREERDTHEGDSLVDADRLFLSGQSNFKFAESSHSSLFGYVSYEDDRLSSYDYQAAIAAGYGSRWVYRPHIFTDIEIGPGYSWNKRRDINETEGELIVRLAGLLNWELSPTARFTQSISTEIGDDNRRSRSVSALTSNINSRLALRLSLTLTHNSTVYAQSDGRIPEKLDTETAATLVFTF